MRMQKNYKCKIREDIFRQKKIGRFTFRSFPVHFLSTGDGNKATVSFSI